MKRHVVFALKGLFNSAQRQRLGIRIEQSSFPVAGLPSADLRRENGNSNHG